MCGCAFVFACVCMCMCVRECVRLCVFACAHVCMRSYVERLLRSGSGDLDFDFAGFLDADRDTGGMLCLLQKKHQMHSFTHADKDTHRITDTATMHRAGSKKEWREHAARLHVNKNTRTTHATHTHTHFINAHTHTHTHIPSNILSYHHTQPHVMHLLRIPTVSTPALLQNLNAYILAHHLGSVCRTLCHGICP